MLEKPNFTMPFNLTGLPALSVSTGYGDGGLPVSMQIVGKPFAEATVFRAGHAYEKETAWRSKRPAMSAALATNRGTAMTEVKFEARVKSSGLRPMPDDLPMLEALVKDLDRAAVMMRGSAPMQTSHSMRSGLSRRDLLHHRRSLTSASWFLPQSTGQAEKNRSI